MGEEEGGVPGGGHCCGRYASYWDAILLTQGIADDVSLNIFPKNFRSYFQIYLCLALHCNPSALGDLSGGTRDAPRFQILSILIQFFEKKLVK